MLVLLGTNTTALGVYLAALGGLLGVTVVTPDRAITAILTYHESES